MCFEFLFSFFFSAFSALFWACVQTKNFMTKKIKIYIEKKGENFEKERLNIHRVAA